MGWEGAPQNQILLRTSPRPSVSDVSFHYIHRKRTGLLFLRRWLHSLQFAVNEC